MFDKLEPWDSVIISSFPSPSKRAETIKLKMMAADFCGDGSVGNYGCQWSPRQWPRPLQLPGSCRGSLPSQGVSRGAHGAISRDEGPKMAGALRGARVVPPGGVEPYQQVPIYTGIQPHQCIYRQHWSMEPRRSTGHSGAPPFASGEPSKHTPKAWLGPRKLPYLQNLSFLSHPLWHFDLGAWSTQPASKQMIKWKTYFKAI